MAARGELVDSGVLCWCVAGVAADAGFLCCSSGMMRAGVCLCGCVVECACQRVGWFGLVLGFAQVKAGGLDTQGCWLPQTKQDCCACASGVWVGVRGVGLSSSCSRLWCHWCKFGLVPVRTWWQGKQHRFSLVWLSINAGLFVCVSVIWVEADCCVSTHDWLISQARPACWDLSH